MPPSPAWDEWRKRSQEPAPAFDLMPSIAFLPDPLRYVSGKVATKDDWTLRRQELLGLVQKYLLGTLPISPGNIRVGQTKSRQETGAFAEEITLEFGPDHKALLNIELLIPKLQGGPFPVVITPRSHRAWALVAVSRGYVACVYRADEQQDDSVAWRALWPDLDWSTVGRRAWAVSRCVDYLETLPFVDQDKVALAAHGLDGKIALYAAAFDQRIKATVSSSAGPGGACAWRLFSEAQFGPGIEQITRTYPDWFHPRLRFFSGRESKLPIDQSALIASVAPRALLVTGAANDPQESIWAVEQSCASARRAYELLDRGAELHLLYRPPGPELRSVDVEVYFDWLDAAFRRKPFAFPGGSVFPTYAQWQEISGEKIDLIAFSTNGLTNLLLAPNGTTIVTAQEWGRKRDEIRGRILWSLGDAPPFAENAPGPPVFTHATESTASDVDLPREIVRRGFTFGNMIKGHLYLPRDGAAAPLPVVIWLHPLSISTGYETAFAEAEPPYVALARQGWAVLAFDQIGCGSRVNEVRNFYPRYPHWSLLGKQVEDTLAAVEALLQQRIIDPRRIYLLGYSTGGMIALHAAALDDRVAGVVSIAGFSPLRTDTVEKGTGGIARWAGWLPLQPRLGAFVGREAQVPYDYHEVLAMIAPRPALIFAPRFDHQTTLREVKRCVEEATKVYQFLKATSQLQLHELNDYNRFPADSQRRVYTLLNQLLTR